MALGICLRYNLPSQYLTNLTELEPQLLSARAKLSAAIFCAQVSA